jgi:signal transduction histidine kinase/CheY-like chemotaxis protein
MTKHPTDGTTQISSPVSVQTREIDPSQVQADLTALTGDLAGRRYLIGQTALIGRDPEANIQVLGDDVSRKQAQIRQTDGGDFVIEDLHSRNGTLVNGIPVEVHVLRFGDKVQIGARTLFVFTRHHALEEQLVQWQRLELVGQMTAGMVHDFNNYMCVVLGYIDYIQENLGRDIPEERLREIFATSLPLMETAAREGASLAQKVLQFSRASKQGRAEIDLKPVVEETANLVRRTLARTISVEVEVGPNSRITGERTELMQVLINLLLNARDAMPDGGTVRIQVARSSVDGEQALALRANEQVVIRVTDTGCGMDEETRRRIFEPLFTTKASGKGTGLGLSMVARIVESHGGTVRVSSAPGRGAEFAISFPAAGAGNAPLRVTRTQEMGAGLRGESRATPILPASIVLALETSQEARERVARALCPLGFEVLFVTEAEALLDLHTQYQPQVALVVVSTERAREETAEIHRRLRATDPQVKVLFTTIRAEGHSDEGFLDGPIVRLSSTKVLRDVVAAATRELSGDAKHGEPGDSGS